MVLSRAAGRGGCLRRAPDFPFLLLLASGGSFLAQAAGFWPAVALQSALCPLLTFGDLRECGFGPGEPGSALLARVKEPGSAPGIGCARTGPALFPIVARREPGAA